MDNLHGRVAVVTGAGSGIGAATARRLAQEQAAVVVADIDLKAAEAVTRQIQDDRGRSVAVQHDARDTGASQHLVDASLAAFARIDILVTCAGVGPRPSRFEDVTESEYDRVMDVNAKGVFLTCRAVAPVLMKQQSGRIVTMASVVAKKAPPFGLPYSMSKFAVVGLTQVLARELASYNINVNAVCPGIVDTPLIDSVILEMARFRGQEPSTVREGYTEAIPLGRMQSPQEVADLVAFLASDQSASITGSAINVNGGMEFH